MQVSSITSTQNPKPIMDLLTPKVRGNLPALTPLDGTVYLNSFWAAVIYLKSPDPKQHIPGKIWLVTNSDKWQPHLLLLQRNAAQCSLRERLWLLLQAQLPTGQEKLLQLVWIQFCSSTKEEEGPWVAGAEKAESSVGRCKDAWRTEQHRTASFLELKHF